MNQYLIKHFAELTSLELYQILQLRNEVFILEQNCFYQDIDNKDLECYHLLVLNNNNLLIGYARLLPTGISYDNYCSIGRVLIKQEYRRHNFGKVMMNKSIDFCKTNFSSSIKIGAQKYLEKFYSNLGFTVCGEEYLEDDIPHLPMKYNL